MADFKRFTGFIAPDNTTHDTLAKVKEHVRKLKVKEAATKFATAAFDNAYADYGKTGEEPRGFVQADGRLVIAGAFELTEFLIENQAAIQAVFNQSVRERAAPRKAKAKVVSPADAAAGIQASL